MEARLLLNNSNITELHRSIEECSQNKTLVELETENKGTTNKERVKTR
jgi:hypothetical protein